MKRLLTGTLPVNNSLMTGTVPVNNFLLTGTVRVNYFLLTGNLRANSSPMGKLCYVFSITLVSTNYPSTPLVLLMNCHSDHVVWSQVVPKIFPRISRHRA